MKTLNVEQMVDVNGGAQESNFHCVASGFLGTSLAAISIGVAVCTGPVGWGAMALMTGGLGTSIWGLVTC